MGFPHAAALRPSGIRVSQHVLRVRRNSGQTIALMRSGTPSNTLPKIS